MEENSPILKNDVEAPSMAMEAMKAAIDWDNEIEEPDMWIDKWREFLEADLIPTHSTSDRLWLTDVWRPFRQYFKMNFQPSTLIPAAITRDKTHLEIALNVVKDIFPNVLYFEYALAGVKWKTGPRLCELNIIVDMKENDYRLLVMRHIQKAHTMIKTNHIDIQERMNQLERVVQRRTSFFKMPGIIYLGLMIAIITMNIIILTK